MAEDSFKKERRNGWGEYFLSRADDDSQWGNGRGVAWRPAKNEDLSWTKFFWIFAFNFPLYFVALGLMGVVLSVAWERQGQPGLVTGTADSILQYILGLSLVSGLLDLGVCTVLRNAWNRRARQIRASETVVGLYE